MKLKLKTDILHDKIDVVLWIVAIPLILTNLIDSVYGLIDSWFVSEVSESAIASVAFVGPIQDVATSMGMGVSIAGCSLVARYLGGKDFVNAKKMTGQLITIGFGMGFLASAFFFFFSDQVLLNAGLSKEVDMVAIQAQVDAGLTTQAEAEATAQAVVDLWEDASIYLKISSWSIAFNFITVVCLAIERARGNTKQAVPVNMSSLVIKLFFTWLFTVPLDYGLQGIAFATVMAKVISATICIILLIKNKQEDAVEMSNMSWDWSMVKILLITAVPLALEKSLVSYGFVVVNDYVLAVGPEVLTAYGLTNKVNTLFFKTVASFGTAVSVIVAQHVGAGDIPRAEEAIKKALFISVTLACACTALLLPNRAFVASIFLSPDSAAHASMMRAMLIYSGAVIPWAITETAQGVFQGTGNTVYNLIVSMVRIYILRIPVVWFFARPELALGEDGIWIAMLVSNILAAVFSFGLFLKNRKKLLVAKVKTEE